MLTTSAVFSNQPAPIAIIDSGIDYLTRSSRIENRDVHVVAIARGNAHKPGARRNAPRHVIAIAGRRLLSGRALRKPDAAHPGRRQVPGRNMEHRRRHFITVVAAVNVSTPAANLAGTDLRITAAIAGTSAIIGIASPDRTASNEHERQEENDEAHSQTLSFLAVRQKRQFLRQTRVHHAKTATPTAEPHPQALLPGRRCAPVSSAGPQTPQPVNVRHPVPCHNR